MPGAAENRQAGEDGAPDLWPADRNLQRFEFLREYIRSGKTPWRKIGPRLEEVLCNEELVSRWDAGERNGIAFPFRVHRFVSSQTYHQYLFERFSDEILEKSVSGLSRETPANSARNLLSFSQALLCGIVLGLFGFCLVRYPLGAILILNSLITTYFILSIVYRGLLMFKGWRAEPPLNAASVPDPETLPVITLLLPLYQDAEALPSLIHAIEKLHYPKNKKDIKLLVEKDDRETILEIERLSLNDEYHTITIPSAGPRTKPKACNFGACMARGDLIVIYDAEDHPEEDQLIRAAMAFHEADEKLACVQARLNFYNAGENWLTRLFTLEYSLWFDWLLPALQKMRHPIPLGGTSNFFRGIR